MLGQKPTRGDGHFIQPWVIRPRDHSHFLVAMSFAPAPSRSANAMTQMRNVLRSVSFDLRGLAGPCYLPETASAPRKVLDRGTS